MNCDGCTACCTLLPIEALSKPANTACEHCDSGCTIYDNRPTTCAEFECGYIQSDNLPIDARPDHCGILFIKRTDRIFSGLLMPGIKTSDYAKRQIDSFNEQGIAVVLLSLKEKRPFIRLAVGQDKEDVFNEYKDSLVGNL